MSSPGISMVSYLRFTASSISFYSLRSMASSLKVSNLAVSRALPVSRSLSRGISLCWINSVNSGSVKEFRKAFTSEWCNYFFWRIPLHKSALCSSSKPASPSIVNFRMTGLFGSVSIKCACNSLCDSFSNLCTSSLSFFFSALDSFWIFSFTSLLSFFNLKWFLKNLCFLRLPSSAFFYLSNSYILSYS